MKNVKLYIVVITFTLSSCSLAVKKIAGLKNPRVESKETTVNYLNKMGYSFDNTYILTGSSDSSQIINNILKCLNQNVLLYNKAGNKYCYNKLEKCSGVKLKNAISNLESYYEPCENDTLKMGDIIKDIVPLSTNNQQLNNSNYILFMYWSKFYNAKRRLNEVLTLKQLNDSSNYKISIVLINTDLQSEWGLQEGKRLKLKFKFLGKKSASISFGEIPYK